MIIYFYIGQNERDPNNGRAISSAVLGGKQASAVRANLPSITTPERSYMHSSLAEMADEIGKSCAKTVIDVFAKGRRSNGRT